MAGAISGTATTTATVLTAIRFASAISANASLAGALSTAIRFAASVSASASVTGTLLGEDDSVVLEGAELYEMSLGDYPFGDLIDDGLPTTTFEWGRLLHPEVVAGRNSLSDSLHPSRAPAPLVETFGVSEELYEMSIGDYPLGDLIEGDSLGGSDTGWGRTLHPEVRAGRRALSASLHPSRSATTFEE